MRAHAGQTGRDEGAQGGQAGAGDAGAELADGPAGGAYVVPGDVGAELEVLDADYGDGAGLERWC